MADGKQDRVGEVIDLSKKNVENGIYIHNFETEVDVDKKNTLMASVYKQAFRKIGKIVENSCSGGTKNNQERDNYNNNIIPLIGSRGTGKTSALESIVKFLKNDDEASSEIRKEKLFGDKRNRQPSSMQLSPKFTVLNCIDADRLLEGEKIFENVIIRMYHLYRKEIEKASKSYNRGMDYRQRTLASEFTDVLKSFYSRNSGSVSAIQELTEANARVNIRESFETLVNDFLRFMSNGREEKERFLIIPIDDLDENVTGAYDLMEEIHQYLMLDKIIVLVTMDLTQFSYICEKHFSNIVPTQQIIIEESREPDNAHYWKTYVTRITQNYVDKILPTENRIHLPGIHNENRKVSLVNFEVDHCGTYGIKSIKWVILYKIFRRTGIICDGLGKKKHYYEPDTIRKVVSLIEYLNQMDIVMDTQHIDVDNKEPYSVLKVKDDQKDNTDSTLRANLESIYKDVVERMEYEKLQPEKKEEFDDIRRQYRSRQHRRAFSYFRLELLKKLGNEIRKVSAQDFSIRLSLPESLLLSEYQNSYARTGQLDYSYGNYQYILNEYSLHADKKMIHMILALQTTNMTSLYNEILLEKTRYVEAEKDEKRNDDNDRLKELFEDLRQIIGNSLSGKWSRDMLAGTFNPRQLINIEKKLSERIGGTEYSIENLHRFIKNKSNKKDDENKSIHLDDITFTVPVWDNHSFSQDKVALFIETVMILLPDVDIQLTIEDKKSNSEIIEEQKGEQTEEAASPEKSEPQTAEEQRGEQTEEAASPENPEPQTADELEGKTEENGLAMKITIKGDVINNDILGFVMWDFDNETREKRIENNISINICAAVGEKLGWKSPNDSAENYEKEIKEKMKSHYSLDREAALPFYSQDVYYNLLKRLKENKKIHFDILKYPYIKSYCDFLEIYNETDIGDKIPEYPVVEIPSLNINHYLFLATLYLKLLGRIESLLEREDGYYNCGKENENNNDTVKNNKDTLICLKNNFNSCYFVKNLLRVAPFNETADYSDLVILLFIGIILAYGLGFYELETKDGST